MKKWIVFLSVAVLIGSILLQVSPAEARSGTVISLEEENVVLPDSDVELISMREEASYAVVNCQDEYSLFLSENEGATWRKIPGEGLPEEEKFVSLGTLNDRPEVLVLATLTSVYLSRDGGENFEYLGGPAGLEERGEQITSLAVSDGNPPKILIGVWHPDRGEFPQEGVYLWGSDGKYGWKGQGMWLSWQGSGYQADVTQVSFSTNPSVILAVASSEKGTYLNMGYLSRDEPADWNWPQLQGWPVEIAESSGGSPTEEEILSSKIVFPGDLEVEDPEMRNFYILYNSLEKEKDDVYKIEDVRVRRLEIPDYPEIVSLDSLDYNGSYPEGTLAIGATVRNGDSKNQIRIYCLSTEEERESPPYWSWKRMKDLDAQDAQAVFAPDFARSGVIFVATSGRNSSFARSNKDVLIPISLMDVSGEINQLSPSPEFPLDRTVFLSYGDQNILRVELDSNYRLKQAERILFVPEEFDPDEIRIEPSSDLLIFIFEAGTDRYWLTRNGGLSWGEGRVETKIVDSVLGDEEIAILGKDGTVYRLENGGKTWVPRTSSGIRWPQGIESGPGGKTLVVGGRTEEYTTDVISLVSDGQRSETISLPESGSDVEVVFSPEDNYFYYGIDYRLYRLPLGGKNWEEVAEVEDGIAGIMVSPQGLYLFCQPYLYFSPFPLKTDSQWEKIDIEGDWMGSKLAESERERNLLVLWDYSEILVFTHLIPEKEPEVVSPKPTRPEPVKSEPVEPEPTEIESATPEPATPEPPKIVLAKPEATESPPAEEIFPPPPAPEKSGKGWLITLIVIAVIEALVVVVLIIRERRFYI